MTLAISTPYSLKHSDQNFHLVGPVGKVKLAWNFRIAIIEPEISWNFYMDVVGGYVPLPIWDPFSGPIYGFWVLITVTMQFDSNLELWTTIFLWVFC